MPNFIPDKTDRKLLASTANVIFVNGPVGTGKSSGVVMKIVKFAATKMLPVNGVRRCRVIVARTDMPKLETSTAEVLQQWFTEPGKKPIKFEGQYPKRATLTIGNHDGTVSEIEFILKGFPDNPKEIYDNFSGLPTNVLWINEVQTYSSPAMVEIGFQRTGRYLGADGGNQGERLVICDFNKPSEGHWIAEWEKNPPDKEEAVMNIEGLEELGKELMPFKVEFISWPPPVLPIVDVMSGETTGYRINPEADYFYKQPRGAAYWIETLQANSKNPAYIKTNILNEYGFRSDGIPVFNHVYRESIHVAKTKLMPDIGRTLYIGSDPSGFRGAAIAAQFGAKGLEVYKDFCDMTEPMSFNELLTNLITPWIREHGFQNENVVFVLDPANAANTQHLTPRDECRLAGFKAYNAPSNDPDARIESLRWFMQKLGGLSICPSPDTKVLRQALGADYYWKKQGAIHLGKPRPEKTRGYSDVADSLTYLSLYFRRGAAKEEAVGLDGLIDDANTGVVGFADHEVY